MLSIVKMTKSPKIRIIPLLKLSVMSLLENKIILFPFFIIFSLHLLILEILYFFPRWPLNVFFGPIIRTAKWGGEEFLHYPANFVLIPKLFQFFQMPMFIVVNSFFIGAAIAIIAGINSDRRITLKSIWKEAGASYLHLVLASAIIFFLATASSGYYDKIIIRRALMIHSQTGPYFIMKMTVLRGAPYFKLFLNVPISTLFAYLMPIIIMEKKKIFSALVENFKILFRCFILTFFVVLLPTLFFVLMFILGSSFNPLETIPELTVLFLILTILVMTLIDAVTYTALTTYYLLRKEVR